MNSFVTNFTTKSIEYNLLRNIVEAWNAEFPKNEVTAVASHTGPEGTYGFAYAADAETVEVLELRAEAVAAAEAYVEVLPSERKWTVYDACAVVEGFDGEEHNEDEQLEAWQYLVDTGVCWSLQGAYGRGATALIQAGLVRAAK
jgi:hypothetical protein